MADPNTTKPSDEPKTETPIVRPVSADIEKELRGTIARLQDELANSQSEAKALNELLAEQEKSRADAKAKKLAGPRGPVAKVAILGEGRRWVKPGQSLKQSELDGLTEGEHFEFALL